MSFFKHQVSFYFARGIDEHILSLDEKELAAKDIPVYYRSIPKVKHQQKQTILNLDETNPKMVLFTNTM